MLETRGAAGHELRFTALDADAPQAVSAGAIRREDQRPAARAPVHAGQIGFVEGHAPRRAALARHDEHVDALPLE